MTNRYPRIKIGQLIWLIVVLLGAAILWLYFPATLLGAKTTDIKNLIVGALVGLWANLFVGYLQSNKSSAELETKTNQLGANVNTELERATNELERRVTIKLTEKTDALKNATDEFREHVRSLFSDESQQTEERHGVLHSLVGRIEQQVSNLEDASRRILDGFPKIFRQAERMIVERTPVDLDILTFTPCFGQIHVYNESMLQKFHEQSAKSGDAFSERARTVRDNLAERADNFQKRLLMLASQPEGCFRLVTFKETELKEQFLNPLRKKLDPKEQQHAIGETVIRHNTAVCNIQANFGHATVDFVKRMPLQIFIAKYHRHEDFSNVVPVEKRACLVFFIGTDTPDQGDKAGGFYTELPSLIDLLVDVFEGIVTANKLEDTLPSQLNETV